MPSSDNTDGINLRVLAKATPEQLKSFTPAQVALLGKSKEEILEKTAEFSFDMAAFLTRITSGDDWQRVIQGHLYLDHCITAILAEALQRPDEVRLSRMGFTQKLELIQAMALLPDDLASAAERVNRLRNQIAHGLDFKVSRKDVVDLANATPKHLRDAALKEAKPKRKSITLADLLKVIVLMVDIFRQRHAYSRLIEEQGSLTLRLTLDQAKEPRRS